MIDSLNHRTEVPTDLEFDSVGQQLKLVIAKPYKAGEQVRVEGKEKANQGKGERARKIERHGKCCMLPSLNTVGVWLLCSFVVCCLKVFMSYGRKSNDELLQFYGFIEMDNPADSFVFPDLLAWLGRQDPIVIEREEKLAAKGLTEAVR